MHKIEKEILPIPFNSRLILIVGDPEKCFTRCFGEVVFCGDKDVDFGEHRHLSHFQFVFGKTEENPFFGRQAP